MADFNEITGRVGELSDEEIVQHRQSALDEFEALKGEGDLTDENVTRMHEIADFVATLTEENKAREVHTAELAAQADEASSRIAELTVASDEDEAKEDEPEVVVEEEVEEVPVEEEEVKDDEEDKEKDETFSTEENTEEVAEPAAEVDAELSSEDEEKELSTEEPEAVAEVDNSEETFSDDSEAPADEKDEDTAEATAEADNKETKEEDHLFNENTEENIVATTPEELSVQDAPEDTKVTGLDVTITAGAGIPGINLGTELNGLEDISVAFSKRLQAMGNRGAGVGEQHSVATFSTNYPADRELKSDRATNESRLNAVTSTKAITAAGGFCAPLPVDEELITYGSSSRPVRDSLPKFNAERAGVIYLTPPTLADVEGAVSIWTLADDYAAIGADLPTDGILPGEVPSRADRVSSDPALANPLPTSTYPGHINGTGADVDGPVKPCIRITCGEEIRAYVDAIPQCFTIGNMQARAYPELIEKHLELALVWQARFAEQRLLTRMGNLSTKVRTKSTHGITRDFLNALSTAVAGFRSRHRLEGTFALNVVLPVWFRDAIRADMLLQIAGDGQDATFGLTDATIDRWISERGVRVIWALDGEDGQVFGEQDGTPTLSGAQVTPGTEADLVDFPDEVVWYLYPEGGFVFLDGGTLDLGIVRDSTLNGKNDYQIFVETFEGLIKRAPETYRVATPLNIVGATTGTVEPDTLVAGS